MKIKQSHKTVFKQTGIVIAVVLLIGCSTAKKSIDNKNVNRTLSVSKLIKAHEQQRLTFKTMQARAKVSYTKDDKEQTHNLTLRIKQNEIIWINAFLNVVRCKITPQEVAFYNKLDDTYFKNNFGFLSQFLNVDISFEQLQSLLFGEIMPDIIAKDYTSDWFENSYHIIPVSQNAIEAKFVIHPQHFKLQSQTIINLAKQQTLNVSYANYQTDGSNIFPKRIVITAQEKQQQIRIEIEIKSVTFDEDLRFPFSIPSGFKKIDIE